MIGQHAPFIIAAYLVVIATVGGLAAWLIGEGRTLAARIAELEARGVRRRSAGVAKGGE